MQILHHSNLHLSSFSLKPFGLLLGMVSIAVLSSAAHGQNTIDRDAMLAAVNAERTSRDLNPLTWNTLLEEAATRQSEDMEANQDQPLSHTGSDGSSLSERVSDTGYSWSRVAENIARGQQSVESVMEGWMNSDGHRANILNENVTELGASRVGNQWAQVFATPANGGGGGDDGGVTGDGGGSGGDGGGSGGDGGGEGGEGGGTETVGSEELKALAEWSLGLAAYYYNYFSFFGNQNQALAYNSYYNGLADYYENVNFGSPSMANYSLYAGLANSYFYLFSDVGDYASAEMFLYYYLAYSYYYYYEALADLPSAERSFNELLAVAFGY